VPYLTTQVRTGRVWRNVLDGDLQGAIRWIEMSGLRAGDDFPPYRRDEYMMLTRMLIALGRTDEALPLLDRLETQARTGKYVSLQLELLKIRMHALLQQGDQASARATLIQALTLAEPGGYIRMFLDEGEAIQPMLAPLAADPSVPAHIRAYAVRLLSAAGLSAPHSTAAAGLPEPLSAREYDVLRLLAAGHTNQEIAARLVVALSTVRTHLQHIYAKLGVRNRVEAIAKARALGIIAG
jgi:LuxR family maltose regulon positive regulatory protein